MAEKTTVKEVVELLKAGVDQREGAEVLVGCAALQVRMPDGAEFVVSVKRRFVEDE